jgi:hypothetical protein
VQLPLQLVHAFLLDIDALEALDPDPDPDPDPFDSELIEAPVLSSLPISDIVYHHYRTE